MKLAFRNLPRRKARTTLTIIAVVLGVALLVGINLATASANSEFTNYINRFWGPTDIIVRQGPFYFGDNTTQDVGEVQGVRQASGRISWLGSLDNTTLSTEKAFQLVGLDPRTDFEYASFNITGTRAFSPGQVVVSENLAKKFGLSLGSAVTIYSLDSYGNSASTTAIIAGIDHPLRNLGIAVYMDLQESQRLLRLEGKINRVYASLDDPTKALEVRDLVQRVLGSSFDVSAPKAETVQRMQGQMAGFQLGLNVMIAVALVVCSFIVFNTLFMTVKERTYEIGVMRAVGTSRSQVFRAFLAEGLLIGLIGTATGVVAGFSLSNVFISVAETYLEVGSLPEPVLTLPIIAVGLSAGLTTVLGGSLYPAVSASRTNIIQAIRPTARNEEGRVPDRAIGAASVAMLAVGAVQAFRLSPFHISYLDIVLAPLGLIVLGAVVYARASRVLAAVFFPASRAIAHVAARSGRRRLVRNAVSFGMITITLSFVIMLGGIQGGIQTSLEQGIREALGADIILVANQSLPISFASDLTRFPEVVTATPLGPSGFSWPAMGPKGNASVGAIAVDPAQFPRIIAYNFVNSPPSDQVYAELGTSNETLLMPDALASRLGVVAGGSVTLSTYRGEVVFRVAGVFTGPILQYVRFGENFVSESVIVSFNAQQRHFANPLIPQPGPVAQIFLVDLKPEDKPKASTVAHDIAVQYPQYNLGENSVTLAEILSLVRTTIDRIFTIILLILYFALLIATLGIAANMIMNVQDRRREIGLLRSQGMSMGQIRGLFLGEGVTLGLFGFLLAVPGGLLLLRGATNSTSIAGFWLPFIIPWSAIVQSLFLALLAVVAGTLYPAVRASRMEITRALEQV